MNDQHLSALRSVVPGLRLWRRDDQDHHYRRDDSPAALCGAAGTWGDPVPPYTPCRYCAAAIRGEVHRAMEVAAMPLFAEVTP